MSWILNKTSKKTNKISPDINLKNQKEDLEEFNSFGRKPTIYRKSKSNPSFGRNPITHRNPKVILVLEENQLLREIQSNPSLTQHVNLKNYNLGFDPWNLTIKSPNWMLNLNLSLQNLRFHAMNSKTWTWVPIFKDLVRTNTKTWILMQTFRSNKAFSSRTHEHYFLFLNQL